MGKNSSRFFVISQKNHSMRHAVYINIYCKSFVFSMWVFLKSLTVSNSGFNSVGCNESV